jgi:hypothetical protein
VWFGSHFVRLVRRTHGWQPECRTSKVFRMWRLSFRGLGGELGFRRYWSTGDFSDALFAAAPPSASALTVSLDPRQLLIKRAALDAENFSRLRLVAPGLFQHSQDLPAFQLGQFSTGLEFVEIHRRRQH